MITETVIDQIARLFAMRGLARQNLVLSAVGLLVAWHEDRASRTASDCFRALANRLRPTFPSDALGLAGEWLTDPGLSAGEWEVLDQALAYLQSANLGPIDWTAELAVCLSPTQLGQFAFTFSLPIARAVSRLIALPTSGTCACMFTSATSLAWVLSGEREVTLFTGDADIAIVTALLARSACRALKVDRRNPIDSFSTFRSLPSDGGNHRIPFDRFDHIVSMPPYGRRLEDGPGKGMPFEAYQIECLAGRAVKSFSSIIPDGILFRESKLDTDFRRGLAERYCTAVMSLPSGMFWPASGISTSLLHLEPAPHDTVRVIDGRTMAKTSTGRVQEQLIVRHLEQFQGLNVDDERRYDSITIDELADAKFSLLPERYLRTGGLAAIENALSRSEQITLVDVADIERGKAPLPIRDLVDDPPIAALEIAPADIVDGEVRTPSRQVAFEVDEEPRVRAVSVAPGDILVSIKGNVGIIGIVGDGAALGEVMGEPWIVSQSLAIIRWKPNPHLPSAALLNAILTAPWVRKKLESMSGATTVRTLPISAVRGLAIPVPTVEECAQAKHHLDDIAAARADIEQRVRNLGEARHNIWTQLWHVSADFGEN